MRTLLPICLLFASAVVCQAQSADSIPPPPLTVFPNPFTDIVVFHIHLPEAGQCRATLYDVIGRVIAEFDNTLRLAGDNYVPMAGEFLLPGVYICMVSVDDHPVSLVKIMKN